MVMGQLDWHQLDITMKGCKQKTVTAGIQEVRFHLINLNITLYIIINCIDMETHKNSAQLFASDVTNKHQNDIWREFNLINVSLPMKRFAWIVYFKYISYLSKLLFLGTSLTYWRRKKWFYSVDKIFNFTFFNENCFSLIKMSLAFSRVCSEQETNIGSSIGLFPSRRHTIFEPMMPKFNDTYMRHSISMG